MPTVLRIGGFRFFFYAGDREEPEHVHVEGNDGVAKFWLNPVKLERSGGLLRRDIGNIQRIIEEHREDLMEAWHAYFEA